MSRTKMPRPSDAEFDELKRKRDEATSAAVLAICAEEGWDPAMVSVHSSHAGNCYCACPDGPCQHVWDGKPYEEDCCWSATCSRCGTLALSHDMRVGP